MYYYTVRNHKIIGPVDISLIDICYTQGTLIFPSASLITFELTEPIEEDGDSCPIPKDITLAQYKAATKYKIDYLKESKKYQDTITIADVGTFNSDKSSVELIESNINLHNILNQTTLQAAWWNNNNVDTITSLSGLVNLASSISTRIFTEMEVARQTKAGIDSATTTTAIDSILTTYED